MLCPSSKHPTSLSTNPSSPACGYNQPAYSLTASSILSSNPASSIAASMAAVVPCHASNSDLSSDVKPSSICCFSEESVKSICPRFSNTPVRMTTGMAMSNTVPATMAPITFHVRLSVSNRAAFTTKPTVISRLLSRTTPPYAAAPSPAADTAHFRICTGKYRAPDTG